MPKDRNICSICRKEIISFYFKVDKQDKPYYGLADFFGHGERIW